MVLPPFVFRAACTRYLIASCVFVPLTLRQIDPAARTAHNAVHRGRAQRRPQAGRREERPCISLNVTSATMNAKPRLPDEIEDYRDERWRREERRRVETAVDAEAFIEDVGLAACLTDSRRPGPSLYVAVCGRGDAVLPRNVQKDPEVSFAWTLKDELVQWPRHGRPLHIGSSALGP